LIPTTRSREKFLFKKHHSRFLKRNFSK